MGPENPWPEKRRAGQDAGMPTRLLKRSRMITRSLNCCSVRSARRRARLNGSKAFFLASNLLPVATLFCVSGPAVFVGLRARREPPAVPLARLCCLCLTSASRAPPHTSTTGLSDPAMPRVCYP